MKQYIIILLLRRLTSTGKYVAPMGTNRTDRSVFPHLPWMAVFENENFEEKENIRVFTRVARYDGWLDSDRL